MCCAVKPTALQHESGLLFGGCWRTRPTYHTYGRALFWLLDFVTAMVPAKEDLVWQLVALAACLACVSRNATPSSCIHKVSVASIYPQSLLLQCGATSACFYIACASLVTQIYPKSWCLSCSKSSCFAILQCIAQDKTLTLSSAAVIVPQV